MPVVLHQENIALSSYTRVNNRYMNSAGRKVLVGTTDPKPRFGWPLRRNIMGEIDDFGVRESRQDYPFHHRSKRPLVAEVSRNRDYTGWF